MIDSSPKPKGTLFVIHYSLFVIRCSIFVRALPFLFIKGAPYELDPQCQTLKTQFPVR